MITAEQLDRFINKVNRLVTLDDQANFQCSAPVISRPKTRLIARIDFVRAEAQIAFFIEKYPQFTLEKVNTKVINNVVLIIEKE